MRGGPTKHVAVAAGVSGTTTAAEQSMLIASATTAAALAVTTALVAELVEVYLAASARTGQYRAAHREPGPDLIAADLADALGGTPLSARSNGRLATQQALATLATRLLARSSRRLVQGATIGVGVAWSSGASVRTLRKVVGLEMRPPTTDELDRMRDRAPS
jgi:hypothetical protein